MTRGLDWRRHKPPNYSEQFNMFDLYNKYWRHVDWTKFYTRILMMIAYGVLVPVTNTRPGTYVIDEDNAVTRQLEVKHG